jgi:hypothetical protein
MPVASRASFGSIGRSNGTLAAAFADDVDQLEGHVAGRLPVVVVLAEAQVWFSVAGTSQAVDCTSAGITLSPVVT